MCNASVNRALDLKRRDHMPLRFITHVAFQLPGLSGKRLIDTDGVIRGQIFVVFYGPGGGGEKKGAAEGFLSATFFKEIPYMQSKKIIRK